MNVTEEDASGEVGSLAQEQQDFFGECLRLSVSSPEDLVWDEQSAVKELGAVLALCSRYTIPHHAVDKLNRWVPTLLEPHGLLELSGEICVSAYGSLGLDVPGRRSSTVLMCVASSAVARRLGLSDDDLFQPALRINGANQGGLELLGAAFVTISGSEE